MTSKYKEENMRYLFERTPALVQCYPKAKWAALFYNEDAEVYQVDYDYRDNYINDNDCFKKYPILALIEIPYDEYGGIDLQAEFWDEGDEEKLHQYYLGMWRGEYLSDQQILGNMTPIYPNQEPENEKVRWNKYDLKGHTAAYQPNIPTYDYKVKLIIDVQGEYIYFADGTFETEDYFFNNYVQLETGEPFYK